MAVEYARAQQHDRAKLAIQRFLGEHPNHWRGICVLGWIGIETDDYAAALECGVRAASLAPDNEWPYRVANYASVQLDRVGQGLEYARKAHEIDPDAVLTQLLLVFSLQAFGLREDAMAVAMRMRSKHPDQQQTRQALVRVAPDMEQSEGVRTFEWALSFEPTNGQYVGQLARILCSNAEYARARLLLEQYFALNPRNTKYGFSQYASIRGRLDGPEVGAQLAREFAERGLAASELKIRNDPSDFRHHVSAAQYARALGQSDVAHLHASASSHCPGASDIVTVWRYLALTASALGKWSEARSAMYRAYEIDPTAPFRWIECAEIDLLSGDLDAARRWCELVLHEQPKCESYVRTARAFIARCDGRITDAAKYLDERTTTEPFNACIRAHISACHSLLGNLEASRDAMNEAIMIHPHCSCEWKNMALFVIASARPSHRAGNDDFEAQ